MLQIISNIVIGGQSFDSQVFEFAHGINIKSTWKQLTDTCVLQFPRNLKTRDGMSIEKVIQMGMPVNVQFGYMTYKSANQQQGGGLIQRFCGYVSQAPTAATAIVDIICEDEMWQLKQSTLTHGWANATLDDIIGYIKQQTKATWSYQILGQKVTLGAFKIEKLSAAKVLQVLKDTYGLVSFFKPGQTADKQILIVGKPYEPDPSKWTIKKFSYGQNVISWKGLQYKRANEVLLHVTARNHASNGKVTEIYVGDPGGEERTLDFFNLDPATLKNSANELLNRMKYSGYRGKFPAFGEPVVFHGDVADMSDWRYDERAGQFFIDGVEYDLKVSTPGTAHIRQNIELGPAATVAFT